MFPACLLGMLISLLNFTLIKKNSLNLTEKKMIKFGLSIGILNTILWLIFFYQFGNLMFLPFQFIRELFDGIYRLFYDLLNGTNGLRTLIFV